MQRLLVVAAVVLIAWPSVTCGQTASDPLKVIAEAETLNAKGRYREALALLESLERGAPLDPVQRAQMLCQRGIAEALTAEYDAATRSADEAERLAQPSQNPELLARVELVRGAVARAHLGPLRGAEHYERALTWAEKTRKPQLIAAAYAGLANTAQVLGDWTRVLYYAQRAWDANPSSDFLSRHRYAVQRGIAYYEFGERDAAEQSFKEALAASETAGDRHGVCLSLGELGLVYSRFDDDPAKALDYFDRAIALAQEIKVPDLEVTWLLNSGNVFRDIGQLPEALRRYHLALAVERKAGQVRTLPVLFKNIGQTLRLANKPDEAERFLLDALDVADRHNAARPRWESRMELGLLYRQSAPAKADRYFTECLDTIEQHHSNVLLEGFRAGALGRSLRTYDPYDLYLDFLLGRGDIAAGFVVAERARARAFLDTLTTVRGQLAAAVSPQFVEAERQLLQRISSKQTLLRTGAPDARTRNDTVAEIAKDEEALTTLRLELATEQPALAQARFPKIWRIEDLQRGALRDDEVLFQLFLGREQSTAWIVTSTSAEFVRLPARRSIRCSTTSSASVFLSPYNGHGRQALVGRARTARPDWCAGGTQSRIYR
jgi:tetratricopeptide (TPR) repeat protein